MRMLKAVFVAAVLAAALPAAGVDYADRRYYGDENCLTVTTKVKQERSRDDCHTGETIPRWRRHQFIILIPFVPDSGVTDLVKAK